MIGWKLSTGTKRGSRAGHLTGCCGLCLLLTGPLALADPESGPAALETVPGAARGVAVLRDEPLGGSPELLLASDGRLPDRFYQRRRDGEWVLTHMTGNRRPTVAALALDLNRDGRDDFALLRQSSLELLLDDGVGGFLVQRLPGAAGDPQALLAGDLAGDGDLDLLVLAAGGIQRWRFNGDAAEPGFIDASAEAGLQACCAARAGVLVDLHGHGVPDLVLVGMDGEPRVLINDGRGRLLPAEVDLPPGPWGGVLAGDYDGDQRPDLMWLGSERTVLWRNQGQLQFQQAAVEGLPGGPLDWALWLDLDNDGFGDLVAAEEQITGVWRQTRPGRFQRLKWGLPGSSQRPLVWDLEADGYPDLLFAAAEDGVFWRNPGATNRWLGFRLRGHRQATPLGSTVVVYRRDGSRLAASADQYSGSRLVLGLGRMTQMDLIAVHWPDGGVTRLEAPALDQYLEVVQPEPRQVPGRRLIGVPRTQRLLPLGECR